MDDALFGADPAELRVVDEMAPGLAPVFDERVEGAALDAVGEVGNGCAYDFVAAANGEGLIQVRRGFRWSWVVVDGSSICTIP